MSVVGPARPATASDVAARAGVSRATVSHILNGREARFPEETRQRVRVAAADLDYRPWPAGRSLVRGRTDTIVVLMPNTTIGANVQEAVENLAAGTVGTNVVLRFADGDPDATVAALLELRPFAVVDLGSLSREGRARLAAQGVLTVPDMDRPFVAQGRDVDEGIAELQVGELCKRGPRRIVYVALADGRIDPFSPHRLAAIRRVCARRGLPEPQMVGVPVETGGATAVLREVYEGEPVGIAAYNDLVALAALSAATRLGVDVPGHVSVVGMDRIDVGQLWSPRLTTVDVDMRSLMDATVNELNAAINGTERPAPPRHHEALTLVVGEST